MGTAGTVPSGRADTLQASFRGALLGVVVGDCLGAPFEGHPGPVPPRLLSRLEAETSPLRYTDDTAMTLALAESLLDRGELDLDHLAGRFAATYRRDPYRGYGEGTAELLARVAAGDEWRPAAAGQFEGRGSFGNGSAMRVTPIALHAPGAPERAAELGRASATVTHTHPEAIDAAGVLAAAVSLALRDHQATDTDELTPRLKYFAETPQMAEALRTIEALPSGSGPEDVAGNTGTGIRAVEAVPAAIAAAALNPHSFVETIRFCIAMGGDTDTIAAMAGAIAGARLGEDAIPRRWLRRAEGTGRMREIADRFARQVDRRGPRSNA